MNTCHLRRLAARNRGSGVLLALGVTFLLGIVIVGVRSISSHRVQNTILESRSVKALALAEAGIAAVVTELSNNFAFQTHTIQPDTLAWGGTKTYTPSLQSVSGHNFAVHTTTGGTYHGKLGDGEFKVRCGPIPYKDDPRTKNINEAFAFYRVEAMGRIDDTVRLVEVILKRHYPGRQFLMYDGDVLSLVYGRPGEADKYNTFATGHLYGHRRVEIGQIAMSGHAPCAAGTKQELRDIDFLISGAGHLFFYDEIKAHFRQKDGISEFWTNIPKNTTFPRGGSYSSAEQERKGEFPKELEEHKPAIPDNLKAHVKDVEAGISIPPRAIGRESYKNKAAAGGIVLNESDCGTPYAVPNGWTGSSGATNVPAKILDFGTQLRPGNVTLPTGFNGTIFAEGNLVIKGNPPCNITIFSRKNVFVAGDFNQSGNGSGKERYGFPQNYETNAIKDHDYIEDARKLLLDDASPSAVNTPNSPNFQHHKAAEIIAEERMVFDYRSPIDCFENELYPYMKYQIASYLKDEATARDNVLKVGTGNFMSSAEDEEEAKTSLNNFFSAFPLSGDSARQDALSQKFADYWLNEGKIYRDAEFDQLCREVWTAYRERYENEKSNQDFGVMQLLKKLAAEWTDTTPDKHDDYLYYPEMTTNGIFISCAVRNNTFFAGPDYAKRFCEIGNYNGNPAVGIQYLPRFVHRVFGSEVRWANNDKVHEITRACYTEPLRRKVYDPTLPSLGLDSGSGAFSGYRVLTWRDLRATAGEFNSF